MEKTKRNKGNKKQLKTADTTTKVLACCQPSIAAQCFPRLLLINFWTCAISTSAHISFGPACPRSGAVGLTSPDGLDMRLDVGGIILKYTIFSFFFFLFWKPKAGTRRVTGNTHTGCGQHLSKPLIVERDNKGSVLSLAGHRQAPPLHKIPAISPK